MLSSRGRLFFPRQNLRLMSTGERKIRVGCASGFWGDTPTAPAQLIHKGKVDYLIYDYLSELTMSLLTAAKHKKPDLGYATDFVKYGIGPYLGEVKKRGIRIITNAGGINTESCVAALQAASKRAGVELKIAQVHGDDMMPSLSELMQSGAIKEMSSGKPLPDTVHSMTAYFGAGPIVKALEMGADIVVTGRTADSALALAPLMHEFKWAHDDWDKLAAGSLAGHLIECGGQSTGGLFTDWREVRGYENLGFPVIEMSHDGDMLVTKPPETGGLLNKYTVAEQMLYEIGDPANYILPDVCCDFTNVSITDSKDGVKVTGAKGNPATDSYKVSSTYLDGFKATGVAVVVGGRAAEKARKTADAIMRRTSDIFKHVCLPDFERTHVSIIGAEDVFGANAVKTAMLPREAVIWMSVAHHDPKAIDIWAREIASSGTGMTPGLCGMVGGRPKANPCLKLFSFLYPKDKLPATIKMGETTASYSPHVGYKQSQPQYSKPQPTLALPKGSNNYRLEDLAYARSGDKGDSCNIGVIARHPAFLPYIKDAVTSKAVEEYFQHLFSTGKKVSRFDVPGIDAVNFLLDHVLDGGGIASLRPDPLGKAFAQMLLDFPLKNLPSLDDIKSRSK